MPSRQQPPAAHTRPTAQLARLLQWHGHNDPRTARSRGHGWTRRACSPAPYRSGRHGDLTAHALS
jgi:hypothetical protein